VEAKGSELRTQIRHLGPEGAGDSLADEYLRLNAERGRIFAAIWTASTARGWKRDGLPPFALLGHPSSFSLGRDIREVTFASGRHLTELVRTRPADLVLRELFQGFPDFADECIAALDAPASAIEIEDGRLKPRVPAPVLLPTLDLATIVRVDYFAERFLPS
jgi:hypothetical protein